MSYRIVSSRDGVDLDVTVPTASWAIIAATQDEEAGRLPVIVDDDGAELTLADFRIKHASI
jgi:hypothetical protein